MLKIKSSMFWLVVKYVRPMKWFFERIIKIPRDFKLNQKIKKKIREKSVNGDRINVVFLMQFPEMWNSLKSVYDAFDKDGRINNTVLAVPKKIGVGFDGMGFEEKNSAAIFCKNNGIKYIDAIDGGEWVGLTSIDPDIIFIQRPYDENMPPHLSLRSLSRNSVLCYIPYGYEFGDDVHLETEYNRGFINNVFCCFAENEYTKKHVIKKSVLDVLLGLRKVYCVGYPKFDMIEMSDGCFNQRKEFLWTPRWSTDTLNDRSYFFDYFDTLIDYFAEHKNINLTIRPHPLMFKNFLEQGILNENELEKIQKKVEDIPNIKWDSNKDYLVTFLDTDILITDFSTIIVEFYASNKPIIYCGGNIKSFNPIGKEMAKGFYNVSNKEELVNAIETLINGCDSYSDYNRNIISKYFKINNNIGEAIKNKVIDAYL